MTDLKEGDIYKWYYKNGAEYNIEYYSKLLEEGK